jgi:hypothetical protein
MVRRAHGRGAEDGTRHPRRAAQPTAGKTTLADELAVALRAQGPAEHADIIVHNDDPRQPAWEART